MVGTERACSLGYLKETRKLFADFYRNVQNKNYDSLLIVILSNPTVSSNKAFG